VALGFVALYSNLGHKELRFLLPVLPLWNVAAAAGVAQLWRRARRGAPAWRLAGAAAGAALAAGAAAAALTAAASAANYPGGAALQTLHALGAQHAKQALSAGGNVTVHIDVLPAMTGVSRFGERGPPWVYSKQEGLSERQLRKAGFDYLLSGTPEVAGYRRVGAADGFAGVRLRGGAPAAALRGALRGQLPVQVATAPAVYIHAKIGRGDSS
jgi:alpha-1,6-mannosyltransferase